jgi:photosystem II stability/assembly factor-like uncharacterized protein
MKTFKIFLLISTLCILNQCVKAQEWILQNPFSVLGTVRDIHMNENGNGIAVGANGILLYTDNFGTIWKVAEDPVGISYNFIEAMKGTDGQVALAAGQKLIRTEDNGKTWEYVQPSFSNVMSVHSINENIVFTSNLQQGIYKSVDAGKTWTSLNAPGTFFREVNFIDEMNGFAVAQQENINGYRLIETTDGGQNWVTRDSICDFLGRLEFANDMVGYLTSNCGMFKTTDGGATWSLLNDSPQGGTDLYVFDEHTIWITWGLVYQFSNDGGTTWSERNSAGFGGDMEGVFVLDRNNVWMTGKNVGIAYSQDEGLTWKEQIPGSKANLNSISFVDDQLGFAAGTQIERDVLLVTENGGAIWKERYIGDIIMNDMDNFGSEHIVVGGRRGAFYSGDRGITWNELPNIGDNWIESVDYLSDSDIYLGGSGGRIWKTDSQGNNFMRQVNTTRFIEDVKFANPTIGWAVSTDGKIFHTSDGGLNWAEQHTDEEELEKLYVKDINTAMAITYFADYYLQTNNGGETWEKRMLPGATFWGEMAFMDDHTGWLVGGTSGTGIIYITEDGGDTWVIDYTSTVSFSGISVPNQGERLIWAAGAGGQIARFSECNATPTISNLQGPSVFCKNDTVEFTVDFDGVDIFEWKVPESWNIVGNNSSALIRVATGSTGGEITVNAFNSCQDVTDTLRFQASNPLDNPSAVISLDENILSSDTEGSTYQWYFNGEPIPGASSRTYEVTKTGDYFVEVVYANTCVSGPSNIINVVISSIVDLNGQSLTLYPNPASNYFQLKGVDQLSHVTLWNLSGQLIRQYNSNLSRYDLSHISSGVYMVRVTDGEHSAILKLVVD